MNESVEPRRDGDGNRIGGHNLDFGRLENAVLRGLRENEVLQAVMRFGRETRGGERGARVYVHTSAIPKWVEATVCVVGIVEWDTHEGAMRQVIDAVNGLDEWRTKDVTEAEETTVSEQTIRKHLNRLADFGYIERDWIGRGFTWHDRRLDELPETGIAVWPDEARVPKRSL